MIILIHSILLNHKVKNCLTKPKMSGATLRKSKKVFGSGERERERERMVEEGSVERFRMRKFIDPWQAAHWCSLRNTFLGSAF